ncbi:MAG: insulinase family protein [Deltaproteobacteria bacterium]|nr:insulinase family protein [Deltaproteobacteria bacterium]
MKHGTRLVSLLAAAALACGSSNKHPAPAPPVPAGSGAAVGSGSAAPTPVANPDDAPLPISPQYTVGRLANGITYYILPHKKPLARAQLWLAVNAGSVLEDDDQRGLAHLVEHMAFNGTAKYPKQQIIDFIEKAGMQFGPDVNAYTSYDETVYQLTVPTDDATTLGTGLDVLREWAGNMTFAPEELEKERGVVLEEWRRGRGAGMRLYDKQAAALYFRSRYADRIPIGLPEVFTKAPRETVVRYYKDWYRPDNMAVIAVGDFDPAAMKAQIERRFGDMKGPASPRPRTLAPVPFDHDLRVSVEADKEMPYTQVQIYDKHAHQAERSRNDYRTGLVDRLFHAMLNERLQQLRRRPGAPFLYAGSGTNGLGRTDDAYIRSATAETGHAEDALRGLLTEVARVERFGFTAGELERAKTDALRGLERDAKEFDKTDPRELTDEITRNFFTAEQMPGRDVELAMTRAMIGGITLDEENALAKSGTGRGRVITVAGPANATLPDEARVRAIADKIARANLDPWVDSATATALMATPPTAGSIVSTREIPELGVTEWTLSNGAKVVVKPTDFQNDEIQMSAFSQGGTSLVSDKDWDSARFAGSVVSDGGVGEFDPVALDRVLTGKVASVGAWIGELEEGAWGRASPQDLETFLQLIHLRFTAPRKDAESFKQWKVRQRDQATNRRLSPENAFREDMDTFISQNHKRRLPVTPEAVDKVDLDRALAIYKDRFGDASDFTFFFVGNIDLATLKPLAETYLASLPATHRKEHWKDIGVRFPHGKRSLTVKQGVEAKSSVYLAGHADAKWSKVTERDLTVLQMVLDIRLREVLREDMSGVYGVSFWAWQSRQPREERTWGVFFSCNPDNVDKLTAAVYATIAAIQKDGIGDVYLEKVREQLVRGRETDKRENWWWVNQLEDSWRFNDDPKAILELDPLLARVTSANVKAAALKYLKGGDTVQAVLRPAALPKADAKDTKPAAAPAAK